MYPGHPSNVEVTKRVSIASATLSKLKLLLCQLGSISVVLLSSKNISWHIFLDCKKVINKNRRIIKQNCTT